MKKWLLGWLIIGLLAGPALAQHQLTQYVTLFSGAGTGDSTTRLDVQSFSSVLFKVRIDSTGTVNFKGSADGDDTTDLGTCQLVSDTTAAQVDSTTASGDYWCSTANLKEVFVNVSANGSGVTVQAIGSTASAKRGGAGGGGAGTVTSVDASGGVETVSGSAITSTGTIRGTLCVKRVTTTTYTVLTGDRACMVVFANADPIAVTLPEAGTTGFEDKWFFQPVNDGAGTVTITPTTSTIQGGVDLDLMTGKGVTIASDGTNYVHNPGLGLTAEAQGLPDVIAINRTFGGAVSAATGPQFGSSATGRYWVPFDDPTEGLMFDCVVATVLGDCDKGVKIYTGHVWDFKNNSGTSIGRLTESTGAWTNFKLNVEDAGNVLTLKNYMWRPFVACQNGTAQTIWDFGTSNTPTPACKGTNATKGVLEFPDGATDLATTLTEYLHEDWTGAIDATLIWESASTSTNNVLWGIAIACAGPGDDSDPAFTDDDFTADANNATANTYNATAANTVTTTGTCAAGDMMHIRVKRRLSQAGDTLAATAQGVGLSLKLREAQQ